ncbi:4-hydroxyphenylpyruvate dioxygenase family protein [Laspinema olomoucense]|uniref:VOC family protein n=1 Tax=Laspinema olomoucense D3b TaxID=2953688 RepID=A0ABT2N6T0_9CYAN|nr:MULTISPECIES: VOC family protein [unclassified Laspinema]MCT7975700.1 VOC family protein [Laspinema sp. D3d]MCT7977415.1 VOC family protein [Laspinema sp. D3b]MCT7986834.1 VOC family protein [Laspinema sp. D3a]MCT7995257.1 VOC family protein [Laspinema sp. D3c]
MEIEHIHFYVKDATAQRDWFVDCLGFEAIASFTHSDTHTELIQSGLVRFALSSPLSVASPVAQYLDRHPSGVVDIAFAVQDLAFCLDQATAAGAKVLQPIQEHPFSFPPLKWAKIAGWGKLSHTLIQRGNSNGAIASLPHEIYPFWNEENTEESIYSDPQNTLHPNSLPIPLHNSLYLHIDHFVLNVEQGDLKPALSWYEKVLGFQGKQTFDIQTKRSGLHSQVMISPQSSLQFPINEPTSNTSQVQEFLDLNRGPGIQHIALKTHNILATVTQLQKNGVSFIDVPPTYYGTLRQRLGFDERSAEWQDIQRKKILVDWHPETPDSLLLQTFTQPIFEQPTFFFEVIERREGAAGFGEGNFQALFEAIEREQLKREKQHSA